LTSRVTGSSETLSSLSSSLKSPGVVPSSGNLKVPLVGVHGNGEPDVGDGKDIDASIPDARQSSAIRACAAWRAPSSVEIRAFSSAVMSITFQQWWMGHTRIFSLGTVLSSISFAISSGMTIDTWATIESVAIGKAESFIVL